MEGSILTENEIHMKEKRRSTFGRGRKSLNGTEQQSTDGKSELNQVLLSEEMQKAFVKCIKMTTMELLKDTISDDKVEMLGCQVNDRVGSALQKFCIQQKIIFGEDEIRSNPSEDYNNLEIAKAKSYILKLQDENKEWEKILEQKKASLDEASRSRDVKLSEAQQLILNTIPDYAAFPEEVKEKHTKMQLQIKYMAQTASLLTQLKENAEKCLNRHCELLARPTVVEVQTPRSLIRNFIQTNNLDILNE